MVMGLGGDGEKGWPQAGSSKSSGAWALPIFFIQSGSWPQHPAEGQVLITMAA